MNELSERDVKVSEHIRDTYAEFDPVPEHVLTAARGALGWGPAHAALWLVRRESEQRPRTCRALGVHTSAVAIGVLLCGVLPSWPRVRIQGVRPATRDRRRQPRSTADFTNPRERTARGRIVCPDRRHNRG